PAEGLALDDGTGDHAVHVQVPGLDGVAPLRHLPGVEGVQAGGEPEVVAVLDGDGVVEVERPDDAEHRAEALGAGEPRAGLDTEADAGRPEAAVLAEASRREEPRLAGFEAGQRSLQVRAGRPDERADVGGPIRRRTD